MRLELGERLNMMTQGVARPAPDHLSDGLDLRAVPDFLRRRWRLIVGFTMVLTAIAAVYAFSVTPRYTAYAQVLLEPKTDKALDQLLGKQADSGLERPLDASFVDTQIELMQTLRVMKRVVETEGLINDPEFNGTMSPAGLRAVVAGAIARVVRLFSDSGTGIRRAEQDYDPLLIPAQILRGSVNVARSGKAYVVFVFAESVNAEKSSRLANAVAKAYIEERQEQRFEAARRDNRWLSERLGTLRAELKKSEDAVAAFRAAHNLISPKADGGTVNEQQLVDLNGRLVAAQAETAEKFVKLQQAERVAASRGNADAIPDVLRSPVIISLRQQDAELGRKEADLVARYGSQYPLVVNVRAERGNLRRSLQEETRRIIITLRNDYEVAKAREDQLKASLDQISGRSGSDEATAVQLRELERTAAANKTLYEDFLSRAKLTQEQTELETRDARIINDATVPYAPSWPKKGLLIGLGLVMGLLVGTAYGIGMDLTAAGFTAAQQVEQTLELPVLATLFKVEPRKGAAEAAGLLVLERPLSRYAEGVRAIWTSLRTLPGDQAPQVLAVTSSFPREAKSTTALSLALSALEVGNRVLLVDADLRRPTLATTLGVQSRPGLTDLIAGSTGVREAIRFHEKLGISVLTAGSETTNPLGLLSSARMRALVEGLRQHFDVIVFDTPPLGPVTDGVVISTFVDKLIFVTAWNTTPRDAVVTCLRKLPSLRKVAGVVLTLVDDRKVAYAGPYGYYGLKQYRQYYTE